MTDIKRYHTFFDIGEDHWIKASDHDAAMAEKDKRIKELEQALSKEDLTAAYFVGYEKCKEDIQKIKADAVREFFGKLAAEYESQGFKYGYSALDVARHVKAQAEYYADKLERGEV